jgi:hypothetical protein
MLGVVRGAMLTAIQQLKTALMADGIELSSVARHAMCGGDTSKPLTLAEYATTSGIVLRLGQDVWVNAPIKEHNPNFVTNPPHRLEFEDGRFVVRSRGLEVEATVLPVPDYHDGINPRGERYTSYAITHTDRVRLSPIEGCAFLCQFCDLPYKFRYRRKSVEGLIDSVTVALRDDSLPARHVLVSGGTPRAEDYDYENEVYARVCAAFPGVEVDVMMAPVPGLLDPVRLKAIGVHGVFINLEVHNEERARKLMPAKSKIGSRRILAFIEEAVAVFGPGCVSSLLIVGLEDMKDTLRGVQALALRGCDPVLSPFRPDPSTPLRNLRPPTSAELTEIYERSADIVARHGVRLGPRCIPCHHNTLAFPESRAYHVQASE